MHKKDCTGKKKIYSSSPFLILQRPCGSGLCLNGGKTSTGTAHAQRREHAQCVRVCARTPCCACPLLRIRVPEHSVRSVGPETGLFIQSRFFLTTWDSPGRFTDLSCLELKCACVCEGEPASFGRVGQCDVGPLRRKALKVVIFLLTSVATP